MDTDSIANGNDTGGAKKENARTTEISTSVTLAPAHNPSMSTTTGLYKPTKVNYGKLGTGCASDS